MDKLSHNTEQKHKETVIMSEKIVIQRTYPGNLM